MSRPLSFLGRGGHRRLPDPGALALAGRRPIVDQDLTDGQHRNSPVGRPELFTSARFDTPGSLAAEVAVAGVADVTVYEVEGPRLAAAPGTGQRGARQQVLFAARGRRRTLSHRLSDPLDCGRRKAIGQTVGTALVGGR